MQLRATYLFTAALLTTAIFTVKAYMYILHERCAYWFKLGTLCQNICNYGVNYITDRILFFLLITVHKFIDDVTIMENFRINTVSRM